MLSFRTLKLAEPGRAEIGRRAKDYLPEMEAVIIQLMKVLDGHFALVIGESEDGIHEAVRDLCVHHGMKLVRAFTRRVINQAFFVKAVKREVIWVFASKRPRKSVAVARMARK